MLYVSQFITTPVSLLSRSWAGWKAAYDRATLNYYNQMLERHPEAIANEYWNDLHHSRGSDAESALTDQKLSQLMHTLLKQGVSKFAVDCFILELRRLRRTSLTE